ncbi:MAG: cytidylate kinase-like family protein [Clostridia bacterium]|nr:cytidylate kinase-like family protein [Clostridia bacterium]
MSKIITISREFGSGGRELGKRLAEALNIPCYDYQIIEMVAEKQGLDKDYVENASERDIRAFYPTTIGVRFSASTYFINQSVELFTEQTKVIRELAEKGDCIIVGRCADVLLSGKNPLNIFVYADKASKIKRCQARAKGDENLSEKEIEKKMKEIDKSRADLRKMLSDTKWGDKEGYHLLVNTSGKEIKSIVPGLAAYVNAYFNE